MRSAGLRAEVGGWRNKEEDTQCVMCCKEDEENVEHVLLRCAVYRGEQKQLWDLMETECGGWGWLEEEEKVRVLVGQNVCGEGGERLIEV